MENLKVNTLKPLRKGSPKCEDFRGRLREVAAYENLTRYGIIYFMEDNLLNTVSLTIQYA